MSAQEASEVPDLSAVFGGARLGAGGLSASVGRAVAAGDMVGLVLHPLRDDRQIWDLLCYRVDRSLLDRVAIDGEAATLERMWVPKDGTKVLDGARGDGEILHVVMGCLERAQGVNEIGYQCLEQGAVCGSVRVPAGASVWVHRQHGVCVGDYTAVMSQKSALLPAFVDAVREAQAGRMGDAAIWDRVKSPWGAVLTL